MFDIRQRLNPAHVSAQALLFMNPPLLADKYLLTAHDVVRCPQRTLRQELQ